MRKPNGNHYAVTIMAAWAIVLIALFWPVEWLVSWFRASPFFSALAVALIGWGLPWAYFWLLGLRSGPSRQ